MNLRFVIPRFSSSYRRFRFCHGFVDFFYFILKCPLGMISIFSLSVLNKFGIICETYEPTRVSSNIYKYIDLQNSHPTNIKKQINLLEINFNLYLFHNICHCILQHKYMWNHLYHHDTHHHDDMDWLHTRWYLEKKSRNPL